MIIDNLIALILARIITLFPNYLSLLKKLEIGVFFFCWRCYLEARNLPGHYGRLDENLKEQALSEYNHAQVFCKLTGSKLNMSGAGLMKREEKQAFSWSFVEWDSSNESYQVDGMSTRYLSAKIFFGFRTANSYNWENRIAFMCALEDFQHCFYQQLVRFVPPEVQEKLAPIIEDELTHAINLNASLWLIAGVKRSSYLLLIWQIRKYLALICVPVDALRVALGILLTT
ncbi:hypothetical protein NIES4072_31290 [Nostoc commune NIES-4072]|uniref:Ferritin-like domain-containing protein n=1 Tax=Nostoc commune NIES-4072 TaxID=2005467 RepID=A0A2R5FUG0_NOSCO|nr:hypothetical protein [Nostoc commune]BBD69538.1 hypothetical protein NIES4070_59470 [Nostoc commune HK-02]GBG19461.1 hypothetical protein NIES4072_31290 [Nostoc commune NIES-4072]